MVNEDKPHSSDVQAKDSPSSILSPKIKKVLNSQLETDFETQEALKELSTFFTENTLKNRRYLRGEIERRSLQINEEFLQSFAKVKEALDDVQNEIKAINSGCIVIKEQLDATKSRTKDLVSQTTSLQERGNTLERREALVKEFLKKYQLSPEQIEALELKPIGSAFFASLERSVAIHAECKKWVASSGGQQTTALHIMEEMTSRQEKGIQRLYRWTVDACRSCSSLSGMTPVDSDLLPIGQ